MSNISAGQHVLIVHKQTT